MSAAYQWTHLLVLSALAQDGGGSAPLPGASTAQVSSVWDFVARGGPVMIPIALGSLIALAVIVERLVSLRRRAVIPPDFLPGLQNVMRETRGNRARAIEYCRESASPVAEIFAAGIRRLGESVELLEKHIQEAGERVVLRLRKYMRLLSVIASISPLLGLLGTIFGMIKAFQTVAASGEALGRTELLAKGIYEAMITTAAGLLVTIPVLIAYHWIAARIDLLVAEMDRMGVEFIEEFGRAAPTQAPPALRYESGDDGNGEAAAVSTPPPAITLSRA